ncbi:hypothetical protein VARIO8X_120074 [Burkholderiales bacterium 8X]|nr:hypothetical protein VARIO8X_120074 [Burkholderiales bacterium 8X]
MVLHLDRHRGGDLHRLDAPLASRAKALLVRDGEHPGRRHRQRDRPDDARLRGRLPRLPSRREALPGLQRGRQRHHRRRDLPDPRRTAPHAAQVARRARRIGICPLRQSRAAAYSGCLP